MQSIQQIKYVISICVETLSLGELQSKNQKETFSGGK